MKGIQPARGTCFDSASTRIGTRTANGFRDLSETSSMSTVAIIADTHSPSRASAIPEWIRDELEWADHVVHAGDFDSSEAYETVRELSSRLTAVSGNMDPHGLDLPDVDTLSVEGVSFVVTHGTGPVENYRERVAQTVREHDENAVGIAGHTHEVLDEVVAGIRLLNPGSATGAAPASEATMYLATVEDGSLDVELREDP
jgi:putative phosphoesterase